jgi:hypothetical protein
MIGVFVRGSFARGGNVSEGRGGVVEATFMAMGAPYRLGDRR